MKLMHDRILIEDQTELEIEHNGIVIPATARASTDHPYVAKVLAVGPGKVLSDGSRQPMSVKPGDRILYYRFSGTHVKLDGGQQIIIKDEEVQGIFED